MRPRKHDAHLPTGIYFRHGAYYRVVKGVWYRIGAALDAQDVSAKLRLDRKQILAYSLKVMGRAKQNATGRRGLSFALTQFDVRRMLDAAGWKCAVTGAPFTLEVVNGKRPYAPSIDRINNSAGYTPDNCRVVCVAANYAMNVWGEAVLRRLLRGLRRRVLDTSNKAA